LNLANPRVRSTSTVTRSAPNPLTFAERSFVGIVPLSSIGVDNGQDGNEESTHIPFEIEVLLRKKTPVEA